jgi:hypothetical protein
MHDLLEGVLELHVVLNSDLLNSGAAIEAISDCLICLYELI